MQLCILVQVNFRNNNQINSQKKKKHPLQKLGQEWGEVKMRKEKKRSKWLNSFVSHIKILKLRTANFAPQHQKYFNSTN